MEMGYSFSIDSHCNNFSAEACAISEAIKWCDISSIANDILLLTDSLSTIQALENNKISAGVNEHIIGIRKRYFELSGKRGRSNKKLVIGWIPAHKGIHGNEIVDQLAKEATAENPCPELKIHYNDLRSVFKDIAITETTREIKAQANYKGKFYFNNFFEEESKYPWFAGLNLPRRFTVLLNRLRANHYNLNESLERKGYTDTKRCDCGAEVVDINHIIFTCSKYNDQRIELFNELDKIGVSQPECIWNWLRKEELTTLKAVYKFIVAIRRTI